MNCRPGDLAYIVGAKFDAARHNGKIVRCVRLIDFDGPTWIAADYGVSKSCIGAVKAGATWKH